VGWLSEVPQEEKLNMANATAAARLRRDSAEDFLVDSPPFEPDAEAGSLRSERAASLTVRRSDIEFMDVEPGWVEICITVRNTGSNPSGSVPAVVQSAPLGAFVAWQPRAILRVPPLEPGESAVLRTRAARPMPKPLGPPDRLPPAALLTALGFDDRRRGRAAKGPAVQQLQGLPPSPLDLLTGPGTYWAGNLNVFVGRQPVERHAARSLRILAGRTNITMFVIGDRDSYRFDLVGMGPEWNAQIVDAMSAATISHGFREGAPIEPGTWTPLRGASLLFLVLQPPVDCRDSEVEVHVTQQSTRKTAVVEFSFDPRADGPGCYVVQ
jgi:hypothetical protein